MDERPVGKIDVEDLRPRFYVVAADARTAFCRVMGHEETIAGENCAEYGPRIRDSNGSGRAPVCGSDRQAPPAVDAVETRPVGRRADVDGLL